MLSLLSLLLASKLRELLWSLYLLLSCSRCLTLLSLCRVNADRWRSRSLVIVWFVLRLPDKSWRLIRYWLRPTLSAECIYIHWWLLNASKTHRSLLLLRAGAKTNILRTISLLWLLLEPWAKDTALIFRSIRNCWLNMRVLTKKTLPKLLSLRLNGLSKCIRKSLLLLRLGEVLTRNCTAKAILRSRILNLVHLTCRALRIILLLLLLPKSLILLVLASTNSWRILITSFLFISANWSRLLLLLGLLTCPLCSLRSILRFVLL